MAIKRAPKKRLVTSLNNLPVEIQEMVKAEYPLGFTDAMMRIDKPNGDFFYAVPFATEEIDYLVKINVKVDNITSNDEKDIFDDDIKGADDLPTEDEEEEEPRSRRRSPMNEFDDNDDDEM
ncbi:MAG: hypothetical protein SNG10_04980 [Rikenellaceae bacterium]